MIEGVISLANDPSRLGGTPAIHDGSIVRERQILVHILDFGSPLQVNAKVPEARIARVRSGQKAQVKVDAFPGEVYTGVVTEVAPLPDAASRAVNMGMGKVFTTRIKLDKSSKAVPSRAHRQRRDPDRRA